MVARPVRHRCSRKALLHSKPPVRREAKLSSRQQGDGLHAVVRCSTHRQNVLDKRAPHPKASKRTVMPLCLHDVTAITIPHLCVRVPRARGRRRGSTWPASALGTRSSCAERDSVPRRSSSLGRRARSASTIWLARRDHVGSTPAQRNRTCSRAPEGRASPLPRCAGQASTRRSAARPRSRRQRGRAPRTGIASTFQSPPAVRVARARSRLWGTSAMTRTPLSLGLNPSRQSRPRPGPTSCRL
jgi:hypothetical protein